ncbi:type I-E CRISPR-associated protein Cas7/Cse4/CasC [Pseudomonas sp. NW5]|uniref:type I-E CRISPR-associated protein Cas7/Cse4/CasC n=1 Tax=Pseudomonas sp. NW5 TaxID=2934934 RepID=UPI0020202943|nr:type I-E CRISPR-associated protein Cas7/Cse4/CasC [Pseudomonas sp. NW5]MCL7462697.1 type I-E CRISPR-associated protein Cas7/Cse4/CasC [Pseudomonas sp. NW5]
MSLFVEFHLIQNFAPSNLNRDDTGAPKDALFGGYRRARVSSQCQKKNVRDWFKSSDLLGNEVIGVRTRYLDRLLETELKAIGLQDCSLFNEVVKLSAKSKKKSDEQDKAADKEDSGEKALSYLLFVSATEVESFRAVIAEHAESLLALAGKKKIKPTDIPDALKKDTLACLARSRAVDIALFGRMLADLRSANQYAACQVAHAISTHKVEREFDYFTAVDEALRPDESGAAMINYTEFNSATFYRYAVVDAGKLRSNLQGDRELTLAALKAFTQAMVRAIPTGKQNTFAAHNLPAFVGVCLRHASPINLANAFESPVRPQADKSLTEQSVQAMAEHEGKLANVYADARDRWAVLDLSTAWPQGKGEALANLDALASWVSEQVAAELEG